MKGKQALAILTLALAAFVGMGEAHAGPAKDVVSSKQAALFKLIEQPKSAARQQKINKLFDTYLNYDRLAKSSLGKTWWKKLTPAQRTEFAGLLQGLVRNAYRKNLEGVLEYEMVYVGEKKLSDGSVLVESRAKPKDARDDVIELDFRVKKIGGVWFVIDIFTEGSSLVRTYRSQFTRILRRDGFEALTKKMKKKLAKGK